LEYFNKQNDKQNNKYNERIDRHKIAAAFLASIVKTQPMQVINVINPPAKLRTANELLSLYVGIHIIKAFYDSNDKNNSPLKISSLPKCQNESYDRHFIKIIYHLKIKTSSEKNVFDVAILFLISHIYFLLEQYFLKNE
jgi:hypothetical protein